MAGNGRWGRGAAVVALAVLCLAVFTACSTGTEYVTDPTDVPVRQGPTTTFNESPMPARGRARNPNETEQRPCSGDEPAPAARGCEIVIPVGVQDGERHPAVILLHGYNSSGDAVAANGGWQDAAAREGFVLVLPEGQGRSWNAGECCGTAKTAGVDDIGHLRGILDRVVALPSVDPARVFVVGESNGGMMAYAFGCAEAGRLAGMASVEGTPTMPCAPVRPISAMHVHGRADETVPYDGGQSALSRALGVTFRSVPVAFDSIVAAMGCQALPSTDTSGAIQTRTWVGCGDGSQARLVSIDGMGHTWPTGDRYDATTEILRFFGVAG